MGEWRRVRIGDVCDIIKGETGLASATPGQYPMVATGAERRSCSTYQFDTEAVCIPLVSSTGHGKKTLNYVHYQSGKFALGTILAAVIPKDQKVLTARYLHLYLSHFKDTVLVPLMKGAANVTLPLKGIASVEIPVPPVDQQQKLIALIGRIGSEHLELLKEGCRQAGLFKHLRQAVLQEAVEGKLTADWRRQHPVVKGDPQYDAAALLAQIKAEKERLAKAGKIRKEKPLPPIADSDKPFELTAGWVRCRLGEVGDGFQYGSSSKSLKEGKTPVLRMGNIQRGKIDWSDLVYTNDQGETKKYRLAEGDLLFNRTNSRELVGKTGLFDGRHEAIFAGYLVRVSMLGKISPIYANYVLNSKHHRDWCDENKTDALGQSNINATKLRDFLFPLPPLAEQQAIIARVDSLMATIDALEAQVTERKEQAQLLMQAVLREAFAGGDGSEGQPQKKNPIPTPAPPLKGRERSGSRRTRRERTDVPLVAEPATVYAPGNIPQRILAIMQPGREYSCADLLSAAGIREVDWIWAIRQLRTEGKVMQLGEKRGARYRRKER